MYNYKTVEEVAEEWGVTSRHIQQLCRDGKIEGAAKRAGAWFIPEDTPSPIKNNKSGSKGFSYDGTKKKIFHNAIQLFTKNGYENVSMNDIASVTGIRQSSVYNHFKCKRDILDTIYNYYTHYFQNSKETIVEEDSNIDSKELLEVLLKGFHNNYEAKVEGNMNNATKIIMQRISTDDKAAEIFHTLLVEDGVDYVEERLNHMIEEERIAPADSHIISILINSVRLYTFLGWLLSPSEEEYDKMLEDEKNAYQHIMSLINELEPKVS